MTKLTCVLSVKTLWAHFCECRHAEECLQVYGVVIINYALFLWIDDKYVLTEHMVIRDKLIDPQVHVPK